jgi:hypothetical protein
MMFHDQMQAQPFVGRILPWLVMGLAGVIAPGAALVILGPSPSGAGPIIAVALMASGMIAAAAAGHFKTGVALALLTGLGLALLAAAVGAVPLSRWFSASLAMAVASISFAARGALFSRSAAPRGWWVAAAVVAGEAAMLATAAARPDALPDWLLALLPAQWASAAIGTALGGAGFATSELVALAGTAAATMLVTRLLPRRWPYLIMFSVWIGLSALVLHNTAA